MNIAFNVTAYIESDHCVGLILETRFASLNSANKEHWSRRHKRRRAVQAAIQFGLNVGQVAVPPSSEHMLVTVVQYYAHPRERIHDDDNFAAAFKPLFDALVGLGFLRDDSRDHVTRNLHQSPTEDDESSVVVLVGPATAPTTGVLMGRIR